MIAIVLKGNAPIYEQLVSQIEELILRGVLMRDDLLPSVREMACDLAVNPNTVQRAYSLLEERGLTYIVPGKGRFVAVSKEELEKRYGKSHVAALESAISCAKANGITMEEAYRLVKKIYDGEGK